MNEEELNEMIIKCPACGIEGVAKSIMKEIEIPHFGKVLETTIQCPSCGFKHSDIIALEQNDPAKYVIEINKNTLSTRVVRSQSATVSIPEVGVKVEPGPKSEGYVTNIEGMLTRFESAVKKALNLFDDEESQNNAKNTLTHIQELKKGNGTATLIILDPFGQSNIVSENVKVLEIPEEELHNLKTGFSHIEDK
ncbi:MULTISPECIES: ZPR1 zinc finger domain-containing protein [unclassified Methanobrevibacter]|uniref:ZPR1 zinc finger domain-containing protein n=1 Tax=unclassified Methanobrevibacter TaxID=2638681 RepID=UPI001DD968A7|nr:MULTISPECIES: ZPR1 zinc finger domain-containing protein [unclassified Methanobrevibacter]MBE6491310.1 ZPR1 zinc finger domain-containing protein [Methanobrevibacter sp.]MEE0941569.1 ZPR1 zinc finger domain-containing protein [Methanobrevibacter sp.]